MAKAVYIGAEGKTISFPDEPASTAYTLINTYTSSQTWTAPENGWYKFEVFGASGSGGSSAWVEIGAEDEDGNINVAYRSAAGGGGGGYSCSIVQLMKGDTVTLTCGAVGAASKAVFNSTVDGVTYNSINVTSGGNGGSATSESYGAAGTGGTGSGGNQANKNGSAGSTDTGSSVKIGVVTAGATYALSSYDGGAAGYSGGNAGGMGAYYHIQNGETKLLQSAVSGKKGFIKVYSGNTNGTNGTSGSSTVTGSVAHSVKSMYVGVNNIARKIVRGYIGDEKGIARLFWDATFPDQPASTAYTLINTYTTSQTWTAPENGWFKIEVFGASGKGGNGAISNSFWADDTTPVYNKAGGGGGASGGYACSVVKMNQGDTITLTSGAVGATTRATISSSLETYSQISIASGGNGGNGSATTSTATGGTAGTAGTVSGGNITNTKGRNGSSGSTVKEVRVDVTANGGKGGTAVVTGANVGGAGGSASSTASNGSAGKAGFFKIYRGNTN